MESQADVVVYTLSGCPYCTRAKRLLDGRGIGYEERNGDGTPGFRGILRDLTGGSTVPQILIDGRPVGGSDDLAVLADTGLLEALIARAAFPQVVVQRRRTLTGTAFDVLVIGEDLQVIERHAASGREAADALAGELRAGNSADAPPV